MILQTIRTSFPEAIRTVEQDMLIGDSCLTLTDKEREEIENLNVENYQYNSPQRTEVSARVADAIYKAQLAGAAAGAAVGAFGGGAIAWKTTKSLPMTALAGATGGVTGGVSGYYAGEKIGHMKVVKDIENSPEYHKWKNEKYENIIFPALSRYVDDRCQWENSQMICPITLDFMLEPVQAIDGHIYDKSAILAHLAAWRSRLPWDFDSLSKQRKAELLQGSSPFRIAHITADTLKPLSKYYKKFFTDLVNNYNTKVLEQKSIANLAKDQYGPLAEQATKIVKLYSMTQRERDRIANRMRIALLNSAEDDEFDMDTITLNKLEEFIKSSAALPKELQLTG